MSFYKNTCSGCGYMRTICYDQKICEKKGVKCECNSADHAPEQEQKIISLSDRFKEFAGHGHISKEDFKESTSSYLDATTHPRKYPELFLECFPEVKQWVEATKQPAEHVVGWWYLPSHDGIIWRDFCFKKFITGED